MFSISLDLSYVIRIVGEGGEAFFFFGLPSSGV